MVEPRRAPSVHGRALELRVHGVSGTPPEDLLDRPLVQQIAGDHIAGFYAPRLRDERTDAAPNPFAPEQPDAPTLAGYSWGGLTSGSAGRAFWLVLLPFTLLNIAPRARPDTTSATSAATATIWYLSRVLALLLTLLFTLTGIGIGEDLIAWQCTGRDACSQTMPRWIVDPSLPIERLLLLGAIVPVLLLAVLWFVSARTANRYERTVADVSAYRSVSAPRDDPDRNAVEVGLGSRLMWRNEDPVRRLRAIHLQCGFAVVIWSLLASTGSGLLGLAPLAIILYALVILALPAFHGHGSSTAWQRASFAVWAVLVACAAYAVVGLATESLTVQTKYLCTAPVLSCRGQHGLPFFDAAVLTDSALAVLTLVLLTIVVVIVACTGSRPAVPQPHQALAPGLFGLVAAVLAALGVFLAAAFTSGSYVYLATYLHTGSLKPAFGEVSTIYATFRVPPAVATATLAYTFAAAALVVIVIVWGAAIALRRHGDRLRQQFDSDYPHADEQLDPRRGKQIRRDMWLGSLVDAAPWLIGPVVLAGIVIVAVFGAQLGAHVHTPIERLFGDDIGATSKNFLAGVGAYLVVTTIVGLVTVGALAFRVPATRKLVGILWDVASFWPRACHPLAAPCYAERTVPDLVTFITDQRVAEPDRTVVLSAHSQGTVISAATIWQLDRFDSTPGGDAAVRVLPRLGLLTFGCVLRRLYGRYFPVYFGPARLADLQRVLRSDGDLTAEPRWRNLWRYTDYLGGQVTSGPPQAVPNAPVTTGSADAAPSSPPVTGPCADWEWHAPDPPHFDREPGDTTYPPPHRHSDFWKDESGYFQLAVRSIVDQIESGAG